MSVFNSEDLLELEGRLALGCRGHGCLKVCMLSLSADCFHFISIFGTGVWYLSVWCLLPAQVFLVFAAVVARSPWPAVILSICTWYLYLVLVFGIGICVQCRCLSDIGRFRRDMSPLWSAAIWKQFWYLYLVLVICIGIFVQCR